MVKIQYVNLHESIQKKSSGLGEGRGGGPALVSLFVFQSSTYFTIGEGFLFTSRWVPVPVF